MFDSAELLKDVNVFHNNNKIPKKETEKKKRNAQQGLGLLAC